MNRSELLGHALALRDLAEGTGAAVSLSWPSGETLVHDGEGVVFLAGGRTLRFSNEALDDLTRMGVA